MRFPLHPLCLICWWILLSGATQQSCRIASNYSNSIKKIQLTIQLPSANDDRKVVLPKKWRNCVAIGTAEPFQLLTTSNTNDANFSIHSLHYPWFDFNSFNLIRFIPRYDITDATSLQRTKSTQNYVKFHKFLHLKCNSWHIQQSSNTNSCNFKQFWSILA